MRRPMRLPNITKYSAAVTAGGTSVWPQMRMMRLNSRRMTVWKPMRRMRPSVSSRTSADPRGGRVPAFDQAHEELLEPVHLVAHADDLDPLLRQPREDVVEALLLPDVDLERVVVGHPERVAGKLGRRRGRGPEVQHERLLVELADHARHRAVLDDAAAVDDRDVAAEALGLLQVVRRQDDRRALSVDVRPEERRAGK